MDPQQDGNVGKGFLTLSGIRNMAGIRRYADESHDLFADKSAAVTLGRFEVVYRCALSALFKVTALNGALGPPGLSSLKASRANQRFGGRSSSCCKPNKCTLRPLHLVDSTRASTIALPSHRLRNVHFKYSPFSHSGRLLLFHPTHQLFFIQRRDSLDDSFHSTW